MAPLAILAGRAFTPAEEIPHPMVLVEDGRISAVGSRESLTIPPGAQVFDAGALTLVPGFIDVHVHGAGGHDVMEDDSGALPEIAATLARNGTTSFLATTVTASADKTCSACRAIAGFVRDQKGRTDGPAAEILGIHLEGPFINPVRRGVHPAQWIAQPSSDLFSRFLDAAGGTAKILTLAPEMPGSLDLILAAREAGLVVSMGHSDATYEQASAGIRKGARHAAHVFNAMRPFSHRETGIVGAVLSSPEVTAELIADGVHVDPPAMRLLISSKGHDGVILVSDGTSATGMPDGTYALGSLQVVVREGVCRNREGELAGSTLTLDRALRNAIGLGLPLPAALKMLTLNPARLLGLERKKGQLMVGVDADLVLLDDQLLIRGVATRGVGLPV